MSKFAGLALSVDKPATMTIRHPETGKPIVDRDGREAFISIFSADSARGRAHERATIDSRLDARKRKLTADDIERDNVELLTKLTDAWYLVTLDGDPIDVEFNEANARELYSDYSLRFIREQVLTFLDDRGHFIRRT